MFTSFSIGILFTVLSNVHTNYSQFWVTLELLFLPFIYTIGYEKLMDMQKNAFLKELKIISEQTKKLEDVNNSLKYENYILKINKKNYKVKR